MPAYHIDRSILIKAPIKQVRESLCDYQQWPKWSPWLIIEPDTQLNFNDEQGLIGAVYDWKGELTGEGSMMLTNISDNKLDMDLFFLKPFKSTAKVCFDLEEEAEATKVTWSMDSKLPFFLFWMVKHIKAYIGMDYERGLKMLKDYLEIGSVASKIKIEGITHIKPQRYIGIANECSLEKVSNVMPEDFRKVYQFLQDNNLPIEVIPFAIYNRFDIFNKHMKFISAVPIGNEISDNEISLPDSFITSEIEGGDMLKVTHTGAYIHLGNAWSGAFSFARTKKIKTKKVPVGIEFYLNNPIDTPAEELITEVVLPLR